MSPSATATAGTETTTDATTDAGAAPSEPGRAPVALASGAVAFDVVPPAPGTGTASPARVGPADDGTAVLTVSPGDEPVSLVLTTPGSLTGNADGTVTVLDTAGTAVGGLSAPGVTDGGTGPGDASPLPRATLTVTGPTTAELAVVRPAGEPSESGSLAAVPDGHAVTTTLGTTALRSAGWGDREGGLSLAVDATAWARTAGVAGSDTLWAQVVAAEPDADVPGMHDQLVCHALGAPDKATWNLEPWRPDVGLVAVLAARCNPT
ncbi:hypothetical protein BJF88_02275 [Cellulosimicrobium sp. CUA-896]|nr:hypothetical protein BJF88_02275 [Cellulosimicrobium sp. CUA-896]